MKNHEFSVAAFGFAVAGTISALGQGLWLFAAIHVAAGCFQFWAWRFWRKEEM